MAQEWRDCWLLPAEVALDELVLRLEKKFTLAADAPVTKQLTYCDSFDWRLFKAGLVLTCSGTRWIVSAIESGKTLCADHGPKPTQGLFAKDFGAGVLQDTLAPLLAIRSLSAVAQATVASQTFRLLNRDEKTVVRLVVEQFAVKENDQLLRIARLEPVRGYVEELNQARKVFKKCTPAAVTPGRFVLEQGSLTSGRVPGAYTSRFILELDPDQTTFSAIQTIYKQLLDTIYTNIPGTIADLDSEFLHDLRVAIRRTRSGLSLIKNVLPEDVVEKYKADFAYLGKITGPARDMDVYLLYEDEYKKRLPPSLQAGLHTFFENLAATRIQEQKALVRELKGARVEEILSSWGAYLKEPGEPRGKFAELPVIDIAQKIIFKRYTRVLNDGLAITKHTSDKEIHRLRIQGKKLRYAIEFFSSLFPQQDIETAIKRLKRLQNYLGDFNDLSVQQEMLKKYIGETRPGSRKNLELTAALGGLMGNLHQQQVKARDDFEAIFSKFSGAAHTELFEQLFAS
ncbi:MAG: hypothetical protein CSB34_04410 [Desulfobulbus propionicus]|nr:MAG: hypothetical protein CSB34_04410 [Desulfobulbus propionicus]